MADTTTTDYEQRPTIVLIGASAEDTQSLYELIKEIPQQSNNAYIISPLLSNGHTDQLLSSLQDSSCLPVVLVEDKSVLQPNHLYLGAPSLFLSYDGKMLLATPARPAPTHDTPIDHLFRSVAMHNREKSAGIILSGPGTDGVLGVRAIRREGGLTIAQSTEEAPLKEKPKAAVLSGLVDGVLPLKMLIGYCLNFFKNEDDITNQVQSQDDEQLKSVRLLIKARLGRDMRAYNSQTLKKSIKRRMRFHQSRQLADYLEILYRIPEEIQSLTNEIFLGFCDFFEPAHHYKKLQDEIVPALFKQKRPGEAIRVWTIGCSTGEHAYALGMLLNEHAQKEGHLSPIQIFSTDLVEPSLKVARKGFFPTSISQDVPTPFLNMFFERKQGGYEIKKFLREQLVFSYHELFEDPPFSNIDLVYCNGLLVKLTPEAREKAFSIFDFVLKKDGWLLHSYAEGTLEHANFCLSDESDSLVLKHDRKGSQKANFSGPTYNRSPTYQKKSAAQDLAMSPEQLHADILKDYTASLLVNEGLKVLHIAGDAGRYLTFSAGKPDQNLMKLLHPDLKLRLHRAIAQLQEAQTTNETVAHSLSIRLEGEEQQLHTKVRQIEREDKNKYFLIQFALSPPGEKIQTDDPKADPRSYEEEASHYDLQQLLKDYEKNEEKLTTVNQELAITNEELQSTMDELMLKNEEYSSNVEELRTIHQDNQKYLQELRKVNSDLNNLLVSTDLAVIFLDKDLKIKRFTPKTQELFNLKAQDIDRKISDQTHHLNYPELEEDAMVVFRTLVPKEREVTDRHDREYLARILPYRDNLNKITGTVLNLVDISDTKEKERMRLKVETAQQLAALKDEFISTVSHEIRTPLNAIMGLGKLLLKSRPRKDQIKNLNTMQFSAQGLLRLVNDLLDFSKLEAGKMQLERIDYRPAELVESLRQAHQPAAEEKDIRLKLNFDGEVPDVLQGDSYKLTQVLHNLLSNAIKFTEKGEVKLQIKLLHRIDGHVTLDIRVSDTGIGIPKEKQKSIFEKFNQAENSTMRRFGGTGLGLTISKSLLELMGSDLWLDSEEGKGSKFYFHLEQGIGLESSLETWTEGQSEDNEEALAIMQKASILMVEDIAINRMVLQQYLEDWWGILADEAVNGVEAVEKAQNKNYDLILMDMRMPEMDGWEATRRIRKLNKHYAQMPILALTADLSQISTKDKEENLFDGLVTKPFDTEMLQNTISSMLLPDAATPESTESEQPDSEALSSTRPDFAKAEEAFGDNKEQKLRFYQMVINSTERFRKEISQQLREGDVNSLSDSIHKQKLMLSMFGLEALYEKIQEQRDLLSDGKKPEVLKTSAEQVDEKLQEISDLLKGRMNALDN